MSLKKSLPCRVLRRLKNLLLRKTKPVDVIYTDNTIDNSTQFFLIKNFDEFDSFISYCTKIGDERVHLDEQRAYWHSYKLDLDCFLEAFGSRPAIDCDPFSDEYRDWEMAFFEFLSGRQYSFNSEGGTIHMSNIDKPLTVIFDFEYHIKHTRLYTELVDIIRPDYGTSVLEMGAGHGNLSAFLARFGCNVTALDASVQFISFIKQKVILEQNLTVNTFHGSFYDAENLDEKYDAVIFEESFHHCGEPERLLKILNGKLNKNGRIFFLNEPIVSDYDRPWGVVRYDGETMMQIRKNGWLELGFRTDFFEDLIKRCGYELIKYHSLRVGKPYCNTDDIIKQGKDMTNEEFVEFIYRNILGRVAEAYGKIFYLKKLDSGIARKAIVENFLSSEEYLAPTHKIIEIRKIISCLKGT